MTARSLIVLLVIAASVLSPCVHAGVIYVAPKDSADLEAAKALDAVAVERTFHKALDRAAEELAKPGAQTVVVKLAEGTYTGQAGAGSWEFERVNNPEATLKIVGGYYDGFTKRDPFGHMTILQTSEGRDGAFINFTTRSALAELVISGLVFDAAPSNVYDGGVLMKGSSRTYPLLAFGIIKTGHLHICDNVFINGAHGAFDPNIHPASEEAVVTIENNFFLNNVKLMQVGAGINQVKEVRFRHNTVVLNWPYNPDPTSGDVGALKLHNSSSAKHLLIEGNIFAYNIGGAMQHDWPEKGMPELTIRSNLFFRNAGLFGNDDPDAGAVVGKFGTNPKYLILDIETVEDDFDYTVEGNVVADPKITVETDLQVEEDGDDVTVQGYAPKMELSLPFPGDERLTRFGVQASQVLRP